MTPRGSVVLLCYVVAGHRLNKKWKTRNVEERCKNIDVSGSGLKVPFVQVSKLRDGSKALGSSKLCSRMFGVYRPIYSDGGQFKRLNGSTWMEWVFGDLRILSVGPTHASIKYPVQTYGRYPRLISPAMTLGGPHGTSSLPSRKGPTTRTGGTKLWHSQFFPRQSQRALRSCTPGTVRPLVSGMRVEMSMSLFRNSTAAMHVSPTRGQERVPSRPGSR